MISQWFHEKSLKKFRLCGQLCIYIWPPPMFLFLVKSTHYVPNPCVLLSGILRETRSRLSTTPSWRPAASLKFCECPSSYGLNENLNAWNTITFESLRRAISKVSILFSELIEVVPEINYKLGVFPLAGMKDLVFGLCMAPSAAQWLCVCYHLRHIVVTDKTLPWAWKWLISVSHCLYIIITLYYYSASTVNYSHKEPGISL